MLKQSRGIVLNYVKYSESGIIARVFTEEFGLQSYSAKGVRSKRSKTKIALFEPLTQVEIVAYQKDNKTIHNLKEIRAYYSYQSIPLDLHKRSILIFLDELLIKTLKEESPVQALFEWLSHALTWFDLDEGNPMNFHLVFMMQLTRFWGFIPRKNRLQTISFLIWRVDFLQVQDQTPQVLSKVKQPCILTPSTKVLLKMLQNWILLLPKGENCLTL